jgi:hypothetical protein
MNNSQETELTQQEINTIVPIIIKGLSNKIGSENAVNKTRIKNRLNSLNIQISETKIKSIINYIRVNKLIVNLIADNKGYYVSNDQQEINKFRQSLIDTANNIFKLAESYN